MDSNYPKKGEDCAPYTTLRGSAQAAKPLAKAFSSEVDPGSREENASKQKLAPLEPQHLEHAEAGQTDHDQVDGDDEIQEPRHNQNQDSRDQGDDRGNVRGGDGH
jgi:hypothetical protein